MCNISKLKECCSCRLATKLINESRRKNHPRQLAECTNSGKMWGVAKKPLHTSDRDETRTIDENHTLCSTFSKFFAEKNRGSQALH